MQKLIDKFHKVSEDFYTMIPKVEHSDLNTILEEYDEIIEMFDSFEKQFKAIETELEDINANTEFKI